MLERDERGFWLITRGGRVGPFIRSAEAWEYQRQHPETVEEPPEEPAPPRKRQQRETEI